MKVLLLKSVPKVGKKDDVVDVAEGYAAHALFPKKLAIPATAAALLARDRRIQNTTAQKDIRHALLETALKELAAQKPVMKVRANAQGNLFSKVHPADITTWIGSTYGVVLDPKSLLLPEIKKIGTYTIAVKVDGVAHSFDITLV